MKTAVANVLREGGIGLVLTAVMILIFLGSMRGTISVLISIPVSCLAAFLLLNVFGGTINTMVLGGLALVLSRLIDNSVVVLENIFRHMEEGEDAVTAAERGGQEVQLAVLAATFTTAIVFFPVVFLYGVSKYLFTALGAGRGAGPGRVLPGGDDGCAAVLRAVHQDGTWTRRTSGNQVRCSGSSLPASIIATTACWADTTPRWTKRWRVRWLPWSSSWAALW